jgi:transcription antitermination factor NusG
MAVAMSLMTVTPEEEEAGVFCGNHSSASSAAMARTRKPVAIDEAEVESLRIATEAAAALSSYPYFAVGRKVRVVPGLMTGAAGAVIELKKSLQLVMSITMLERSVTVQLACAQVVVE